MPTLPVSIVSRAGAAGGNAQDAQDTGQGAAHRGPIMGSVSAHGAASASARGNGGGVYDAGTWGHRLHTLRLHPDWPATLRTLHTAAYGAWLAVDALETLASAAHWRESAITRAYHSAFSTLDNIEWDAAPLLAAWERGEREPGGAQ